MTLGCIFTEIYVCNDVDIVVPLEFVLSKAFGNWVFLIGSAHVSPIIN